MIDEKCKNCKELVIPHFGFFNTHNRKLPEEDITGTCRCNVDAEDREDRGYCGWCHPDECRGAGHKYYFDYNAPNNGITFID